MSFISHYNKSGGVMPPFSRVEEMKSSGNVRGSHRRGGARNRSGAYYLCAAGVATLLLLISVSVLYSRLSLLRRHSPPPPRSLSDDLADIDDNSNNLDRIDELDTDQLDYDDNDNDNDGQSPTDKLSAFFYDHLSGAIRRRPIDDWDHNTDVDSFLPGFDLPSGAIGSDDVPVDEDVRRKAAEVAGIEEALMIKLGPLRKGWGDWFDKKADFLRRDKMFKSSFDVLNPKNNPMLQDPDGTGVTALTRADRLMHKFILTQFNKASSLTIMKKPLASVVSTQNNKALIKINSQETHVYADGKRWGFYPGLTPDLSFSDFVDEFFGTIKCGLRVFMVWNSPPWMFSVRYQRGIESLLYHHVDACVLVLSETIELDFFKHSFVKDGYKVAVAMPNLDELLKDTPTRAFASAWFEWRKTKHYPTHYSELVRLAALYKYGGIYLDSDIIVLRPLNSLHNSVGMEDQHKGSPISGAVMAFRKHSPFLLDCMREFYTTYDDTRLRWNGADLLSRVATKTLKTKRKALRELDMNLQRYSVFYPINSRHITRYFISPTTETEKFSQQALFEKILNESYTFHFWNSITSSLIPEPGSLVARLIDHTCIRCSDVL